MENLTITQVSTSFGITPRMLRHYEKMGLITPTYKEDYAYRTYDENAVKRIQEIIILQKLRISLKDISVILNSNEYSEVLETLRQNLEDLNEEISSLDTIRNIIKGLHDRLMTNSPHNIWNNILNDKTLVELSDSIALPKNILKEKCSMSNLKKANETLVKQLPVRLVLLPPFTVASIHVVGKDPEEKVGNEMDKFIRESKLYEIKPDSRYFGFNHPNPGILPNDEHGYEAWVTIPDDMKITAPLVKKHFDGGLFAALTISFPEFYRWNELDQWVKESVKYEADWRGTEEIMGGCLEEHLNWIYSSHMGWPENGIDGQLDLLFPIKKKENNI